MTIASGYHRDADSILYVTTAGVIYSPRVDTT
jgi:hypothetical protein